VHPIDQKLAVLAAEQHQVFTRQQTRDAGLNRQRLHDRIASGRFVKEGTHALRFGGTFLDYLGELQAGLFNLGADSFVTSRASAALFGFDGYPPGPLSFYVPRPLRKRSTTGKVRSGPPVHRLDLIVKEGLRCASPTLTIIHLAAEVTERELANALDSAVRMRLTAPAYLARRLAVLRRPGVPGLRLLDRVLHEAGVESWLERKFLRLVRQAGLPEPSLQRVFRAGGRHVARVDFRFDDVPRPFIAELCGKRGYLTSRERQRVERRRNALQQLGEIVYAFTYEDVVEEPQVVLDTLHHAARAAH
jgi:hypothetical protein